MFLPVVAFTPALATRYGLRALVVAAAAATAGASAALLMLVKQPCSCCGHAAGVAQPGP